jgi:hypothetical protein
MNQVFGKDLETILIVQTNKYWRFWKNRVKVIIANYVQNSEYEIFEMKLVANVFRGRKISLKVGINRISHMKASLKGGWHLVTVKFFETRIFLRTKRNTTMSEIYGRVGNLINVNPKFIKLNARLHPNGNKNNNISPETKVVDGLNRITVIKVELCHHENYNININKHIDDFSQMKNLIIDNQMCEIYKFLKIKSLKRIIVFNEEMNGQWSDIHDAGNGEIYEDNLEIDEIGAFFMLIWYPVKYKEFKFKLGGTVKCKVEEDRSCSIKELTKRVKKTFGLAKDSIIADENGLVYQSNENAIQFRKNLWLSRNRVNKVAKLGEFLNMKIIVVAGEVTIYIDAKIYTLWNKMALISYLNQLTGTKNKMMIIEINGVKWENELSIGALKPKIIRIFLEQQTFIRNVINIVDGDLLNIQAINLKHNGQFITLTGPKNITLGQAFATWCLLGVEIPPFDYIQIDGRKLTDYEYNVELLDHWPWNKIFTLMNNLKGGGRDFDVKEQNMIKLVIVKWFRIWKMLDYDGEKVKLRIPLWMYNLFAEWIEDRYMQNGHKVNNEETEDIFMGIKETIVEIWEIENAIEVRECDDIFDPVPEILRKDMRFIIDLLTLNALNEDDRKITMIDDEIGMCVQFNGRKSYKISHGVNKDIDG